MILDVLATCNSPFLATLLFAVKKIMNFFQIVVPFVLLVSTVFSFVNLMQNPDEKNGVKKIFNKLIAAVIIFFIPVIVNVVMYLASDTTNFSSCWNAADEIHNSTQEQAEK